MEVLNFIITNILTQASIIIGIVALLGLALQRKSLNDIISGTLKTILGFLVLNAGSSVMQGSLSFFGDMFNSAFGFNGMSAVVASIEGINGQAMTDLGLGSEIAICLAGIFVVNIILARLTPFKYVFLTGQALLWESTLCVVFAYFTGLRGLLLILIASLVGGAFATLMPAFAQPIVRKITESDDIALGHFCTFGYMFTALIAGVTKKLFGSSASESAEELELPSALSFMQDSYLAVMVVMIPFYLIVAAFAGAEAAASYAGKTNYLVFAFLQAMQFVVGLYVLLAGVRLLLAELVPAFQGISMKLVPDAKPALDCPVLFTYAPNSVILGFIFTTIGSLIGMAITGFMGTLVIPGVMSNFFAGGTAGIFGNAVDGRRGVIIGCIFHGIFIMILPALLSPMLAQIGFVNMTCTDVDTVVTGFFFMGVRSVLSLFGVAI
ncbi:PTS ascorbate transporter subunit IIC [Collinsella sp. zg1085]|uniref:PTS ascorbate transporter subunit IIC n=1 Tax=Collinsella sp. zg1085 TaxID=2844380 RepID=UPI001C0AEA55|nr:PTS ascorbate transporter subunit IIC [Collinsella sp. zg1085]QWT17662.1 PTS ascorbate transporter subunit IIC [Collinsella sp. zg1085]